MTRRFKHLQSRLLRAKWGFRRANVSRALRDLSAGARVWFKDQDSMRFGVIQTLSIWPGYFRTTGYLVIVLDGDYKVMATTMAERGTVWDLVEDSGKPEPL